MKGDIYPVTGTTGILVLDFSIHHKSKVLIILFDASSYILEHCKKHIAKYAMPYDIEFRESLPKTLVGKVAYTVLEKETNENL